jgi:hypothetical protein
LFLLPLRAVYARTVPPLPRLVLDCALLFSTYSTLLLCVAGQKALFIDLLHTWNKPTPDEHKSLASGSLASSLGLKTIFKWRCSGLESAHGDGHEEGPGAAGAAVVSE